MGPPRVARAAATIVIVNAVLMLSMMSHAAPRPATGESRGSTLHPTVDEAIARVPKLAEGRKMLQDITSTMLKPTSVSVVSSESGEGPSRCPEIPYSLESLAMGAEDVVYSPQTNTLWVVASRTLNQYSMRGVFLSTYELDLGYTAKGIALISGGIFAVATDLYPRLHYYDSAGAANGTVLTPYETHTIQDEEGKVYSVRALTYRADIDAFYVTNGSQELYSMTREGVITQLSSMFEGLQPGAFISGLHWEASSNRLMILVLPNDDLDPAEVHELYEPGGGGVWELSGTPGVPTLPLGQGLTAAEDGQRVLTVTSLAELFAYHTQTCDELQDESLPLTNLHRCSTYALSGFDDVAQDFTVHTASGNLFVLASNVLMEYTVDGDIVSSYPLTKAYLAAGVAYVGGNVFAVVTETFPRLHYYNLTGVGSGAELAPYETHIILLDGEPTSVKSLSYDPIKETFFAATASQALVSVMTADANLTPLDLSIDLEDDEQISGLQWSAVTGSLSLLLCGSVFERCAVLEIFEIAPGFWQPEGNSSLTTVPLATGVARLEDRLLILTELNALVTYSTTPICDALAGQFITDGLPLSTNPDLYADGFFGRGIDEDELWDIERSNYKQCEPFAPLTGLPELMAEDVTFSPETNTIFVLASVSLNEYTVDGDLIRTFTLRNALNASGVTHVEGNVFAVVSSAWPTLTYYDLTGAANGDTIAPYLVLDIALEDGEPITLSTLTHDPARDIFLTSSNNMAMYTMTRTGVVAEVDDLDLRGIKKGSVIAGLHWSEDRGAVFVLVRARQYEASSVQEVVEESNGRWETVDRMSLPIIPTGAGLTFTPLGARMLLVTFLKELYVFSPDDGCDEVSLYRPDEDTVVYLDEPNDWAGEMAFNKDDVSDKPYIDIIEGDKKFKTTYKEVKYYDVGPFNPPKGPLPGNWADECIANLRQVKEKAKQKSERRPNEECPAGFFLCKGMCYTLVNRNNRGPTYESGHESYYKPDYMSVEARCGLCGRARVAFVGEDAEMKRVAAAAAEANTNEDKAMWVRRYRFLDEINEAVEERSNPYQAWHRYVEMPNESPEEMTYQRYYTGEKDGLDTAQYDVRFRNQEGGILCVNTIERISQAVELGEKLTRITWEDGCTGDDRDDKWDDRYHRWWPEDLWPYPGY